MIKLISNVDIIELQVLQLVLRDILPQILLLFNKDGVVNRLIILRLLLLQKLLTLRSSCKELLQIVLRRI